MVVGKQCMHSAVSISIVEQSKVYSSECVEGNRGRG